MSAEWETESTQREPKLREEMTDVENKWRRFWVRNVGYMIDFRENWFQVRLLGSIYHPFSDQ